MFYVFDLDDTLTDTTHRRHILEEKHKNEEAKWNAFFDACDGDGVNPDMANLFQMLCGAPNISVEIWTGRSERVRWKTLRWLSRYLPTKYLHVWSDASGEMVIKGPPVRMRKENDLRDDTVVKAEFMRKHGVPDLVFDDRTKMVEWWRAHGITCLQVQNSEF